MRSVDGIQDTAHSCVKGLEFRPNIQVDKMLFSTRLKRLQLHAQQEYNNMYHDKNKCRVTAANHTLLKTWWKGARQFMPFRSMLY